MQTIVSVRYNRPLRDDVGIPPTSTSVAAGDIHRVLSGHAAWLEDRGFAERVPMYRPAPVPSADLEAFISQLETDMKGPHENKAIAPAQNKRKRGRPKGSKNKAK
jgi:hypothetical protein